MLSMQFWSPSLPMIFYLPNLSWDDLETKFYILSPPGCVMEPVITSTAGEPASDCATAWAKAKLEWSSIMKQMCFLWLMYRPV